MYRASFFTELLHCTQQKDLRTGKALHAQILKATSSSSSTCIYLTNSLVNLYAKCGNLVKARIVFDNITHKDVVSWNCLINAYSQNGPTTSFLVMEIFQRMRAENTFPNAHTFAGVFTAASNVLDVFGGRQAHAVAVKTASFYDVFVGSSLLNMYCKVGLVLEARKVFDIMPERNSVSWSTMISGYAMQRMAVDALEIFELMRYEEEDENEFALTSVLSALVSPEFVNHAIRQ
ncbi:pentatricopeptide repeat-containing protein At2g33680 [Fagus crenata]